MLRSYNIAYTFLMSQNLKIGFWQLPKLWFGFNAKIVNLNPEWSLLVRLSGTQLLHQDSTERAGSHQFDGLILHENEWFNEKIDMIQNSFRHSIFIWTVLSRLESSLLGVKRTLVYLDSTLLCGYKRNIGKSLFTLSTRMYPCNWDGYSL